MASSVFWILAGLFICTAIFYGLLMFSAYIAKKIMKD